MAVVSAMLMLGTQVRVTPAVAPLVTSEMVDVIRAVMFVKMFASMRIVAMPAIVAIEMVVDMTPETPASVIPRSGTDENTTGKPFGSIVAVGCAVVWRVVEIAVRANGRRSNLDGNLGLRILGQGHEKERGKCD